MKIFPAPEILGQYRQFPELATAYKIMEVIRPIANDDWLLKIKLLETGKEVEYPYSGIKQHAEAQ